jgi:hypothetical protein
VWPRPCARSRPGPEPETRYGIPRAQRQRHHALLQRKLTKRAGIVPVRLEIKVTPGQAVACRATYASKVAYGRSRDCANLINIGGGKAMFITGMALGILIGASLGFLLSSLLEAGKAEGD